MTTALIMAGGKGTRMDIDCEKPLIKVNNKTMINHVIDALQNSNYVDNILVAVSPNTPLTRQYLEDFPVNIIQTSGIGYIEDLSEVLSNRDYVEEDEVIMTIVADLPFVTGEQLDDVFEHYFERKKPAMCVSVPEFLFEKHGITPTLVFDGLVPTGVNLLLANNDEQDQTIYESKNVELAFNINTIHDLDLSEKYLH
ncbi:MAG: TIGR00454 family protein [Methanosphaera sp.]|uniref:TIGR00454 family protein n=1 Tax=Methanosphaera sp. ISO3-F5 TaxID=1452353 RepID=UPI002B257407|nr:TIGR00454 family protein [Methanosphaera sp. ISO3-F5]MBR0472800.1 TIGR00454 family protein [Methanosphaera sp.]WQH65199.1 TIGR00454 family protein [Methanosphaera sp. ISO3-F5]